MNSSNVRWLPLTGILSIVLIITGVLFGEPPDASNPPQEIVDFYVDNATKLQVGTIVFAIAAILFVVFGAYMRTVLDRGEGSTGILSTVAFAGAVIFAVGVGIDGMILFGITEAADNLEPTQIQTLQALWDNDWMPLLLGVTTFVLACGLSIILHKSMPVWVGWLALVIGIVGLTPVGWIAFMATGIWVLIVAVMLIMSEGRSSTPVVE
jgi:hypothetical protein